MKRLTPAVSVVIAIVGVLASGAGIQRQSPRPGTQQTNNPRPSSITGFVIGSAGEPVANAQVRLSELNRPEFTRTRQTTAAPDGSFEFASVPRGVYIVSAFLLDWPAQATCRPGDSITLSVSTNKGGVITGKVTDANGKPAIEAPVRAIRVRDFQGRPSMQSGRPIEGLTDDRGVYRIWGLPAGSYIISAGARSRSLSEPRPYDKEPPTYFPSNSAATAAEVFINSAEEQTGLDIRLRDWHAHTISGKVSRTLENQSDQGYVGAVLWEASSSQFEAMGQGQTDQVTGEFKFDALADGDYCLQALAGNGTVFMAVSPVTQVVVKDSDVAGLDLRIRPPAGISGRVSVDPSSASVAKTCSRFPEPVMEETMISLYPTGRPRQDAGAKCQASSSLLNRILAAGAGIGKATPDARGEVSIKPLESGHYQIEVEPPNDNYYVRSITAPQPGTTRPADLGRNGIEIKDGARVNGIAITLAPGAASLSGSVAPAQRGAKLPSGIVVILVPADPQSQDDLLRFAETAVAAGGAFTFKNVAPGRYFLLVQSEQISGVGYVALKRLWWDANTRAELRRQAENANALVELKSCDRVKDRVLACTIK